MLDSENIDNSTAATDAPESKENQAKTFSQEEVNRIVTSRLAQAEKKYSQVDVEEYRTLKQKQQDLEQADAIKRQEFEKVLKQQRENADNEIKRLRGDLEAVKIDGAFINAASKHRAVNPEHITKLLKASTRLNSSGEVEVVDETGSVRYNAQTAMPVSVDDLVQEFIQKNPYFRSAGPAGSGSKQNLGQDGSRQNTVDIAKLNMADPKDRATYKEYRRSQGMK